MAESFQSPSLRMQCQCDLKTEHGSGDVHPTTPHQSSLIVSYILQVVGKWTSYASHFRTWKDKLSCWKVCRFQTRPRVGQTEALVSNRLDRKIANLKLRKLLKPEQDTEFHRKKKHKKTKHDTPISDGRDAISPSQQWLLACTHAWVE